jgi:NADH-quinone oxidoreductase subunit N
MMPDYSELLAGLLPECALVVGALLVLGVDLTVGRGKTAAHRLPVAAALGAIACLGAAIAVLKVGRVGPVFGGVLMVDSLTWSTRLGVLLLAALTLGVLGATRGIRNPAEYVALVLFATAGFTLMAAARQLLVAFLALELASLSLYVLAGFDRTRPESAEAALKYFLFGGISAAFLLFGFSLIYGLTGSIALPEIARQLRGMPANPLLTVALVMVLMGFGFKAAAAPFHWWAPDVYQGAPAPSAALIASASKLAGLALFVRLLWDGLAPNRAEVMPGWIPVVIILAVFSLVLGNVAALAQSNVRRLFAYSAISHAGALLIGVISAGRTGPSAVFYYAATYGLATVGAFGVLAVVERTGRSQQMSDLAGLHRRSPLLAGCLAVFVLSLAGIPPLAGFFGKFVVFTEALKMDGLSSPAGWLAWLAIAMSAVGLYYYLLILKQALVLAPASDANAPIAVPVSAAVTLLAAAALLIALGLCPSLILRMFA